MMLSFTILCFSFFLSLIHAIPLEFRDVFDPPITSPNAQTVWKVGETHLVTWDTTGLPPDSQLTNPNGMVVLGFMANDSENLMLDNPLAQGFKLRDGNVSITVPNVPTRSDYIVVLFGDSGNASPQFTINGAAAPSSSILKSASSATSQSPSTLITTPIPITGSVITGGSSEPSSLAITTTSNAVPTTTSSTSPTVTAPPAVSSASSSVTSTASSTATALAAQGSSSAALKLDSFKAFSFGMASMVLLTIF